MGKELGRARVRRAMEWCALSRLGARDTTSARTWLLFVLLAAALAGCAPSGRAFGRGESSAGSDEEPADDGADAASDGAEGADGADGADDVDGAADADDEADEESLLTPDQVTAEVMTDMLKSFAYRGPGYRKANREPFPSTVAPGKMIDMWVSAAAFDELTAVSPEREGSEVKVPTGTLIVREVWDADALKTLTVMVKLEEGSFPLGGDWWYTVADPDGTIHTDDDGDPIAGHREDCGTCHLRRSHDGFLFGTPDGYLP